LKNQKEFNRALSFVLKWEGFISGEPPDTGGLTIWGISERSHKKAVYKMFTLIKEGKKEEAFEICKNIYHEVYWKGMLCENYTYPKNIIVFDMAVNMGRGRAKKIMARTNTWQDIILDRLYTYSKFKQAKTYFRGWANRVLDLWNLIRKEMI